MTLLELQQQERIKQLEKQNKTLKQLLLAEMQNTEKEKLKNKALCNKLATCKVQGLAIVHID